MRRRSHPPILVKRLAIVSNNDFSFRILSWNLLHKNGASLKEILALLDSTQADILLLQEARFFTSQILQEKGGFYHRAPLKYYRHGSACWSRFPFLTEPCTLPLPSGSIVERHAQIIRFSLQNKVFSIGNLHLSHRQFLNRQQLRTTSASLGEYGILMGDFNMVGPSMIKDFEDIGPYQPTHKMMNFLPLRLDRCLIKGLIKEDIKKLPRFGSDHHPIMVKLRFK